MINSEGTKTFSMKLESIKQPKQEKHFKILVQVIFLDRILMAQAKQQK